MSVDVAIVGGGLSGLAVAHGLHTMGMDKSDRKWALLEAHATRIGGRIKNADGVDIDLGPAWLWPQHQPKMSALARDLGVATFPQPDDSSSTRLVGGAFALVQALHSQLPAERVKMGFLVKKCKLVGEKIELTSQTGDVITSGFAVFAAPPKIVAAHIEFEPALSAPKRRAMAASQTWMAGVTKVALQYPERFWPLQGGVSNTGLRPGPNQPAFQVYDGSSAGDKTIALTFFTVAHESLSDEALARACATQLGQLWSRIGLGQQAARLQEFSRVHVHRWPLETTVSDDPSPGTIHPHPEPVRELAGAEWSGRLHFASTETDQHSPGVMEGAVGAAHRVLHALEPRLKQLV